MLRALITIPRLAGLVCAVALFHIVWLYRRPVSDWGRSGKVFQGIVSGGGGQVGSEKEDFSGTKEAIAAGNETLGFGEVLVISLDYRTDRQDALALLSSLSSLNLTIFHGVTGEETAHSPAIPPDTKLRPSELGCWRSHVNAWKHIIESGVETALITEDDADWHVNIKAQMSLLSQELLRWGSPLGAKSGGWGMDGNNLTAAAPGRKEGRGLLKEKKGTGSAAPYGLDWDIFWIGQCLQANDPEGLPRPGFSYRDTAGAPKPISELHNSFGEELRLHGVDPDAELEKETRIVAEASGPACTTGYAVTRTGAHKLLYTLGYLGPTDPVDMQLLNLCSQRELRSLWVVPPLISEWRLGWSYDSDTRGGGLEADDRRGRPGKGQSGIGKGSARRKMERLWAVGGRAKEILGEIEREKEEDGGLWTTKISTRYFLGCRGSRHELEVVPALVVKDRAGQDGLTTDCNGDGVGGNGGDKENVGSGRGKGGDGSEGGYPTQEPLASRPQIADLTTEGDSIEDILQARIAGLGTLRAVEREAMEEATKTAFRACATLRRAVVEQPHQVIVSHHTVNGMTRIYWISPKDRYRTRRV
ncbi:hypothetical protein FGG08_006296 [Glutinoglossum americanum]|uniref:Glycosyl transferase family 25 domain-containing protein n=1 Tax=Glutinoglossum americanum TaxID=1670608 RepID=A0A9P8I7N7_9PEZI|nr:hypothetical protein FGG08_006296 [Glutinoglossum americanum]